MDAEVKRSRFASHQVRAGPAPLASFEDLPSDELESPEDCPGARGYICNIDDDSSADLQFITPDSLTVSSQSTPRIDSDFESQFTLTPGGDSYQGQSTSDLRTASLSSLTKDDSTLSLSVKQSKGSAVSLGTLESTEVEYSQRKSSWTDIFKSHNQSCAKNSSVVLSQIEPVEKVSKKKSRTHSSKKDSDSKSKDKHKFLSLFKKKSNKSAPVSPDDAILPTENLNIVESFMDSANGLASPVTHEKFSKGKENESPVDNKPSLDISKETQNDLGKTNVDSCDKIPDERKISRKAINISDNTVEKEYNIVLKQVEEKNIDFLPQSKEIETLSGVKEDLESSESDITLSKDICIEKKENDFEAETLLPHDLSEIEEEPVSELQPMSFEFSHVQIPSRQQRLEITTKPIERPRSTTPINVAPLEAFIHSVSPTVSSKIDKIKLSLPGEQIVSRKSPKKTSMKSWIDFCERGLHSPRMYKRSDKEASKSSFQSSDSILSVTNEQFPSDGNWAVFESDFTTTVDPSKLRDSFETGFCFDVAPSGSSKNGTDPYQCFESNFSLSSSLAVFPDCLCCREGGAQSADQKCDGKCACQCHSEPVVSNSSNHELQRNGNSFGASSFGLVSDVPF